VLTTSRAAPSKRETFAISLETQNYFMKIRKDKIIRNSICVCLAVFAFQIQAEEKKAQSGGLKNDSLENSAIIPVQKLENDFYDWHERHQQVVNLITKKPVDMIFIGDSITHMFGGMPKSRIARGSKIWGSYYGHRNAINMGFGWDRTQNVLWRLTNGELKGVFPKVAVILIGTNNRTGTGNARQNTPVEIAQGVGAICKLIHKKVPDCKILLLGVLPRSPGHFVKPIQEINQRLSSLNKEDYISFLNMWDQFADDEGLPKKELMHDGVHPNAAGYQVWAETMEPVLSKLLQDQKVMPGKANAVEGK